jgi:hypothetical protein
MGEAEVDVPRAKCLGTHAARQQPSQWAAFHVLSECKVEKWLERMRMQIELAQTMFNLQHYHDRMVLSAFDSGSIFRLRGHVERPARASQETLTTLLGFHGIPHGS